MKRIFSALVLIGFIIACTPEESITSDNDNTNDNIIHVSAISLDKTSATIKEGESFTLIPMITPENATNKAIIWSSSSEAVAIIDSIGKVTGIKAGSAIITATTKDGEKKATCSLTVEINLDPSTTIGAEHISALSAVLMGKANIGKTSASDLKVGFQYSKSSGILPSNSVTVEATDADANYNYTTTISLLEPATTYYYRSYVRQNSQDYYGVTMNFTTKELSTLIETNEVTNVTADSATLNAKLNLTDVIYNNLSYGFYYGTNEDHLDSYIKCKELTDSAYATTLAGLSHKTQYWFKAYAEIDSNTYYGGIKAFTTNVIHVDSVLLNTTNYTFNTITGTLRLTATIMPSNATDKSIKWSSSNDSVVSVNQYGYVEAIGNGNAIITVTTNDLEKTAKCSIVVAQKVTSISLNETSLSLIEGEEQTLSVSISPNNANDKTINWTSSDNSIATVDENGKVKAVSKGTATIKATANDGSDTYATCSVTVKRLVSSINLDKTTITLFRGNNNPYEKITATVLPSDANNTSITWTSSDNSIAAVNSSSNVVGYSRGTATITATANDGSGVSATCEVEVKQYVTEIKLDKTSISLFIGKSQTLTASISPDNANDNTIKWSSSNESIVTVDDNGQLTPIAKGTAKITAIANDGSEIEASCNVSVYECPEVVDLGLSVKWASFNLGASKPGDNGLYYAWGEIDPKTSFRQGQGNYKWGDKPYNKYGNIDNKLVLEEEDDVAHVQLGGNWRLPTPSEIVELKDSCTWSQTTVNFTAGYLITSKKEGYTDRSIFIPFAGYRSGETLYKNGSGGYYWTNSLNGTGGYYWTDSFNGEVYILQFGPRNLDFMSNRYYGLPVRPVCP